MTTVVDQWRALPPGRKRRLGLMLLNIEMLWLIALALEPTARLAQYAPIGVFVAIIVYYLSGASWT